MHISVAQASVKNCSMWKDEAHNTFFEAHLELCKVIVQDNHEASKRSTVPTRDQGLFLCGQTCDFLHRLLRRIVPRSCLPDERDWDALRFSDIAVGELLSIPEFMQKAEFRAKQ